MQSSKHVQIDWIIDAQKRETDDDKITNKKKKIVNR